MTPTKQQSVLRGMPAITQKVYAAVPIQAGWPTNRILAELGTVTKSHIDFRTLQGCLAKLKDAGLIREPDRGTFQRVATSTPAPTEVVDVSAPPPVAESREASVASPLELLSAISTRLAGVSEEIRGVVSDLETAALLIEEQQADNARDAIKLRQLMALLREPGTSGET